MAFQIFTAVKKDLGDNFVVRRALPRLEKKMVGPFIFWDHMGPAKLSEGKPMTVRAHPHIGLATLTYLFSGQIMHRDSLDNEQLITAGAVNWMIAGKGIVHSERTHDEPNYLKQELEGIQLWVALPIEEEDREASFHHFSKEEIPSLNNGNYICNLILGEYKELKSPVPFFSPIFYMNVNFIKDSDFSYSTPEKEERALYVASGKIRFNEKIYEEGSLITFSKGEEILLHGQKDSKLLLFGGAPYPEPRHIWWNFVSSSKEKIEKAKEMWLEDKMGQVINEFERIPLPKS